MSQKPKVSVVTIAYNQEKYIREALESFVEQKTDFAFEVIVADDHSTDATPEIIAEYTARYPNIFKSILRNKNIGALPNFYDALRAAKGQYLALCEGDDYFTDPRKLQTQADFLDTQPDHALCFHPGKVIFEHQEQPGYIYPEGNDASDFTLEALLNHNYIQTNSVMYRRQNYDSLPPGILPGDWYMHLYHAQFGKIGFINRIMSVYRRHPGGMWWESHEDKSKFWKKYGIPHLAAFRAIINLYGDNPRYKAIVYGNVEIAFDALVELATKDDESLSKAIKQFPDLAQGYVISQQQRIKQKRHAQKSAEEQLEHLKKTVELKNNHIRNLETELKSLKSSRVLRLRNRIIKGKKKISYN